MAAATTSLLSIPTLNNAKLHLPFSHYTPLVSFKPLSYTSLRLHCAAVQEVPVADSDEVASPPVSSPDAEEGNKRKLYVVNLPWGFSGPDIKNLFSECGTVKDVEIIKQKTGKSRGFAFVTMASPEEANAAIEKFNAYELSGRTIRVEFAKRFRKPPTPLPEGFTQERHNVYVSNLAWKARSGNLREFFAAFNPVSTRVVFQSPSGRSAGYGFASFSTNEEAEAAIAELNGKELMERPVQLKISERVNKQSEIVAQESENVAQESENVVQVSENVTQESEDVAQESEEKVT